jgi:taurine--2-oxoglutarate transaminase
MRINVRLSNDNRYEKASPVISERDSVLHSWCVPAQWQAPTIVGGRGAHFWDADGHDYLDMSSLSECSNLGHQHPKVVKAIREQAERLCFVTSAWGTQPRAELAQALLEKAGFKNGRVFFTWPAPTRTSTRSSSLGKRVDSRRAGSSRAIVPITAPAMPAWHSPETRGRVIRLIRSVTALRRSRRLTHIAVRLAAATKSSAAERAVAAVADEIDRKGAESVAAVLMEPNAGTNGIVAPDNYWPGLREVTRSRGVFLIADEVMSAFGRCGEWFAWQRYGDAGKPDLMTLAKGLTGAHLPLGAVVVNENVARHLETQMLFTGLTYSGHPLLALRDWRQSALMKTKN